MLSRAEIWASFAAAALSRGAGGQLDTAVENSAAEADDLLIEFEKRFITGIGASGARVWLKKENKDESRPSVPA